MSINGNDANNQDNAASDSPAQSQSPNGAVLSGGMPFSYNDWLNGRFSENVSKYSQFHHKYCILTKFKIFLLTLNYWSVNFSNTDQI